MAERTAKDLREEFLDHIAFMVRYWDERENQTCRQKLSGLAFSILSTLDGCTELPAFRVVADPHPDDRAYLEEQGLDWVPDGLDITDNAMLHELFYSDERKSLMGEF